MPIFNLVIISLFARLPHQVFSFGVSMQALWLESGNCQHGTLGPCKCVIMKINISHKTSVAFVSLFFFFLETI